MSVNLDPKSSTFFSDAQEQIDTIDKRNPKVKQACDVLSSFIKSMSDREQKIKILASKEEIRKDLNQINDLADESEQT